MKKYVFTAAAILLAAACTHENPETPANVNEENLVRFTIENAACPVMGDNKSKTSLSSDLEHPAVYWSEGDNVVLFDNSGSCTGHQFTGTVQSDPSLINFDGAMDEGATKYWLLYPYNAGASYNGTKITTTLNATQTAVAGSFASNTAIGLASGNRVPGQTSSSEPLEFSNLCAVLSFNIPSYVNNATSVTITSASGTAMAGTISFYANTGAMDSVSGSSSVTLSGSFTAGARYFAVVAPNDYEGGFGLTLTTEGGASYSASYVKTINATPAGIFHLGTLGLKLDVTPTVTFNHTYSGNVLTGTTATLNIPVASDLTAMIDHWTVTLTNKDSGDRVRNYSTNSGTGSIANEYAYLPMGKYTLAASYTTLDGRSKSLPTIEVTNDKEPVFSVNVTGKTSYDYYKSNGASSANSKDGSTIYELGTSVTISTDLLNNTNYNKTYTYSYDGGSAVSVSGNSVSIPDKTNQSWEKHTISASCTFDGISKSDNRDLHVTGLPFYCPVPTSATWETDLHTGEARFDSDGLFIRSTGLNEFARTKTGFYCPEGIGAKISADMRLYAKSSLSQIQITVSLGSITCARQDSEATLFKEKTVYKSTSKTGTLNNGGKIEVKAYAGATGPNATIYNINAVYN